MQNKLNKPRGGHKAAFRPMTHCLNYGWVVFLWRPSSGPYPEGVMLAVKVSEISASVKKGF